MSSLGSKVACLILCASVLAYAQPATDSSDVFIEIRDLGTVLPGGHARAEAINDRGDVVGIVIRADGQTAIQRAVWWPQGGNPELFLGTEIEGHPFDINNRGQIVGRLSSTLSGSQGFLWSVKDGAIDLPEGFAPEAINNRGQIAGGCTTIVRPGPGGSRSEACIWEDGAFLGLGPSSGFGSDINDRGHVTGSSNGFASVWTPQQGWLQLSGVAQGSGGSALNNQDDVVGNSGNFTTIQAFRWQRGQISLDPGSLVSDINERGWVVGTHFSPNGGSKPFLWLPDDLFIELPTLGGEFADATGLNARGEIVGIAQDAEGFGHAVIWTVRLKSLNGNGR